jgi:hypothetical protein
MPVGSYLLLAQRMGDAKEIYLTEWTIVRNYNTFVNFVSEHYQEITHVSFDYDLDVDIDYMGKNGLDCALWFKHFYEEKQHPLPKIYIHSRNQFGVQYIWNVFPFPTAKY